MPAPLGESNHTFKARPVNKAVLESAGDLGVPRVVKREVTSVKEFALSSTRPKPKPAAAPEQERPLYSSFGGVPPVPTPRSAPTRAPVAAKKPAEEAKAAPVPEPVMVPTPAPAVPEPAPAVPEPAPVAPVAPSSARGTKPISTPRLSALAAPRKVPTEEPAVSERPLYSSFGGVPPVPKARVPTKAPVAIKKSTETKPQPAKQPTAEEVDMGKVWDEAHEEKAWREAHLEKAMREAFFEDAWRDAFAEKAEREKATKAAEVAAEVAHKEAVQTATALVVTAASEAAEVSAMAFKAAAAAEAAAEAAAMLLPTPVQKRLAKAKAGLPPTPEPPTPVEASPIVSASPVISALFAVSKTKTPSPSLFASKVAASPKVATPAPPAASPAPVAPSPAPPAASPAPTAAAATAEFSGEALVEAVRALRKETPKISNKGILTALKSQYEAWPIGAKEVRDAVRALDANAGPLSPRKSPRAPKTPGSAMGETPVLIKAEDAKTPPTHEM